MKKRRIVSSALLPAAMLAVILSIIILLSASICAAYTATALDDVGLSAAELKLGLMMSSELTGQKLEPDSFLSDLDWYLYYNPVDSWQQEVISNDIRPEPLVEADALHFSWSSPAEDSFSFRSDSVIRVKNDQLKIQKKIPFPLTLLDPGLIEYTMPTENANSDDPQIIALASTLAAGQDDLSQVALKLFTWVADNVDYTKSDFTVSTAQSASWVLENRYGVCDELTTLFMALARSIGIPARYMSGVAYSNQDGVLDWQAHAWAELYFPSVGWVPFDITYREFGYVDPTHIILRIGQDSNQSTSSVRWVARRYSLVQAELETDVKLIDKIGSSEEKLTLKVEPVNEEVGFGSYNLVKATVKNTNNFYVGTDITLSRTSGIGLIDKDRKLVLLAPGEERLLFWLVRVDSSLRRGYVYTFPLMVSTTRNTTAMGKFYSQSGYATYDEAETRQIQSLLEEEEKFYYSRNIEMACIPVKPELYIYETAFVVCTIRNTGNLALDDLEVCMAKDCAVVNIPISRSAQLNFTLTPNVTGQARQTIRARGAEVSKAVVVPYTVLDQPNIVIDSLSYPTDTEYSGQYNISLLLKRSSVSPAYNVSLDIRNRKTETFEFAKLTADQPVVLEFAGKNLRLGNNTIELALIYQDLNGRQYSKSETIVVMMEGASPIDRIYLLLVELELWIEQLIPALGKI